jgi:hypothetical protein
VQIAQDLAPDGTPINNATAPFPAPNTASRLTTDQMLPPAVDRAAAYPLTGSDLLPLPASIGWPDSTVLTLNNLEAVSGVYQVWYVNPTTNQAVPATGTWTQVLAGDTIATGSGDLAITGGPGTFRIVTDAYPVIGEPDVSDSLSTLLVSIEQGASATSPSTVQPFWSTVLKRAGGSTGGALPFGEFTFGDDSRGPERFVAQGKLAGGVIGNLRGTEFIGSRLEVSLSGLMRPPIGYQYRAYLCESDDDSCAPTNPTTTHFSLGGLMSPSGVSLDAADTAPNDANLSDTRIVKAVVSLEVTGAQTLCDFDRFRLVLEPKNAAGPPLATIFSALLPVKVRSATSCQ